MRINKDISNINNTCKLKYYITTWKVYYYYIITILLFITILGGWGGIPPILFTLYISISSSSYIIIIYYYHILPLFSRYGWTFDSYILLLLFWGVGGFLPHFIGIIYNYFLLYITIVQPARLNLRFTYSIITIISSTL